MDRAIHSNLPPALTAVDGETKCGRRVVSPPRRPGEQLRKGIDLVVMTGVRKAENFVFKVGQPRRVRGQIDVPSLDLCRLCGQAVSLVS